MATTDRGEEISSRPWDHLPIHVWERIFTFLPVSSIAISASVCRGWSALVRSRTFRTLYLSGCPGRAYDVYFLLFVNGSCPWAAAYLPFSDRWARFPLPTALIDSPALPVSGNGRLILTWNGQGGIAICDAFTGVTHLLPPMILTDTPPYPLAIMVEDAETYRVVAVSTFDRLVSQVYDSATDCWELKGELPAWFAVVGDAVYLNGLLYCLCSGTQGNQVLSFEPLSGHWAECNTILPTLASPHIFTYAGSLYLTGGLEELGEINGIGVWVLSSGVWKEASSMPSGLFQRFSCKYLYGFQMIDHNGIICYYKKAAGDVFMFDLSTMKWWRASPCPFKISLDGYQQLGHALKPGIDLLRITNDG